MVDITMYSLKQHNENVGKQCIRYNNNIKLDKFSSSFVHFAYKFISILLIYRQMVLQ